jgi:DNA polymerase-3 subunit gamma/tau
MLRSFGDVIARAKAERNIVLASALERMVRPIRFEQGQIEVARPPDADADLPQRLGQTLQSWTGRRWIVAVGRDETAAETAHEARKRSKAAIMEEVRADPLVQKVLQRFPGAEIVSVRERGVRTETGPEPTSLDPDVMGGDSGDGD